MCDFINLVLPAQADIDTLRLVVEGHGRVLEPNPEPRVARELSAEERAYLTTRICDCGTKLAARRVRSREHDEDREAARLRRDGWSEAKIRRWREQRSEAIVRKTEARERSRQDEVAMWIALIGELLDAKVAHVGLLVHWATDGVQRGPVLPRGRLNVETLASLEKNVLYTFSRRT
jgi:hypothetical protein